MTVSQTARVETSVTVTHSNSLDLSTPSDALAYTHRMDLATGTGSDQSDMEFHDQRTLGSGANEDLDFAGGLTGPLGTTLTFARIKYLGVFASASNTTNVEVTQASSNGVPGIFLAAGDGVAVRPGGKFEWESPDATGAVVTASTGDLINVADGGAAGVTYDIVVIGASA